VTAFLLESYDIEPPFAQRRLTVLSAARCGERTDWFWGRVEPPLEVGPHRSLATTLSVEVLAIAPRNVGGDLDAGPWPVHVYICRAKDPATTLSAEFEPDDISVEYWGVVTPASDD
jgi:hypothetical protein